MKAINKIGLIILAALTLAFGTVFSACEKDRTENMAIVGKWDNSYHFSGTSNIGIFICYEIKDAVIEATNLSDEGMIVFSRLDSIIDTERYPDSSQYGGYKYASPNEGYFEYKVKGEAKYSPYTNTIDNTSLYWRPADSWSGWEQSSEVELSDYVTFIARIDGKIIGYAVMYVWTNGKIGNGELLANKEVSHMSEETVRERIQEVIEEHKH